MGIVVKVIECSHGALAVYIDNKYTCHATTVTEYERGMPLGSETKVVIKGISGTSLTIMGATMVNEKEIPEKSGSKKTERTYMDRLIDAGLEIRAVLVKHEITREEWPELKDRVNGEYDLLTIKA